MAGLGDLPGHGDVVAAGRRVAAGMVMYQYDGGSVVLNSKAKDLAGLCQAGINRADGQRPHGDELIFRR